uniref:Uncharacterized protein n=1 Tax=Anopheles dirus TaxID=7168 RepID=A0A182NI36_9DIPT
MLRSPPNSRAKTIVVYRATTVVTWMGVTPFPAGDLTATVRLTLRKPDCGPCNRCSGGSSKWATSDPPPRTRDFPSPHPSPAPSGLGFAFGLTFPLPAQPS